MKHHNADTDCGLGLNAKSYSFGSNPLSIELTNNLPEKYIIRTQTSIFGKTCIVRYLPVAYR